MKTAFDIDSRINITNRIEMTAAVTETMLQNVTLAAPPWACFDFTTIQ